MKLTRSLSLFFVLVAFVVSAALYARLPALVPTHFDWQGHANAFMPKRVGAFLVPGTMVVMTLVLAAARHAARAQEGAAVALDAIELAVLMFLCELHAVILLIALGHPLSINRAVFGGLGLLFVVIGNHFGKLRRNGVVGIRTPWTLSDDENWLLTHRLGGRVFVGGGLLLALFALGGVPDALAWSVLLFTTLVPAVYSFALSRRLVRGAK